MRDLVETVIDGVLQREKMQQHAQRQQKHRAAIASRPPLTGPIDHPHLHATSPQTIVSDGDKDPALWKVSRQFEAIFVQQMMSEMRKTVQKSDFIPSGFAEDVHASMMDQAIAQASVRHHSFGIADNIYRQLEAAQSRSNSTEIIQTETEQTGAKQVESKQMVIKQQQSIQEISASADKLQMHNDITMEANSYAH